MKRTVIVSGLIAGAIVSTIMAISMMYYYKNTHAAISESSSMIIGYLSMLIAFSMIYVGIKNYRDKQNNGLISFGKAFLIGLYISLIASSMYVIVWAIEYNFFMPDFMEKYTMHALKEVQGSGDAAAVQQKTAQMAQYTEMYKNPLFFVLLTFAEIFPVGLLVSLISALILKRKNQESVIAVV